jgi:hypothetical protein
MAAWWRALVPVVLVGVGAVHLLPLSGVLGGERLTALYGVPAEDANLALLLRHRAVLFGLLGAFMVAAAWRPAWRSAALVAGALSVLSFLALSLVVGDVNAALSRVVLVDAVAAAALALAALLHVVQRQ